MRILVPHVAATAASFGAAVPAHAQGRPSVVVRAVDEATRQPLVNAEAIVLPDGESRFTNERGETRIAWPDDGRLRLRVRQIGFRYADRAIARDAAATADTVTVALPRVAYTLPTVVTVATGACAAEADSVARALSISVLEQLRLGAERYSAFRRAYPFRVQVERRTVTVRPDGSPAPVRRALEQTSSDRWGDAYRPGRVVERTPFGGFTVPVLFITALADPVFWRHHCFAARGVESHAGSRVVRMEFSPARHLRTPDWEGSALVDSATSVLRRVEFRIAGLRSGDRPRRLEGYTTFSSPAPSIVIPDTTMAVWWRDGPRDGEEWGPPSVGQLIYVAELKYRKATPAGAAPAQR